MRSARSFAATTLCGCSLRSGSPKPWFNRWATWGETRWVTRGNHGATAELSLASYPLNWWGIWVDQDSRSATTTRSEATPRRVGLPCSPTPCSTSPSPRLELACCTTLVLCHYVWPMRAACAFCSSLSRSRRRHDSSSVARTLRAWNRLTRVLWFYTLRWRQVDSRRRRYHKRCGAPADGFVWTSLGVACVYSACFSRGRGALYYPQPRCAACHP